MKLLKKSIGWISVPTDTEIAEFFNGIWCNSECFCKNDEYIYATESIAQDLKDQKEKLDELFNWLEYLWDATLSTDQLLADWFKMLSDRFRMLTEYLWVEFEEVPETPAIPAKTIIKKVSKKSK